MFSSPSRGRGGGRIFIAMIRVQERLAISIIIRGVGRDKNVSLCPRFEITSSQKRRNCISVIPRPTNPSGQHVSVRTERARLAISARLRAVYCQMCRRYEFVSGGCVTGPSPAQSILLILRDVKSAQLRARAPVGRPTARLYPLPFASVAFGIICLPRKGAQIGAR